MNSFADYQSYDAVGLADLIASGEVHRSEVLAAASERIAEVNPSVNAVIRTKEPTPAPEMPDAPFDGVPILIKDLAIQEGEPVNFGSALFRNYVGDTTSTLLDRIFDSGFVDLGRTSTPEFGLLPTTEPNLFGPTRNPWSHDHSSGGSSGGAAAAVASGMVPLAHASDGGGSIRIPASNCGLFGLKPSRGRTPRYPAGPSDYVSVELGVSRSVRDSAALLDVLHGAAPGDQYTAAAPSGPYRDDAAVDPGTLRIAFTLRDFRGKRLHPQVESAIADTAKLLESLGHEVVEDRPEINGGEMASAFVDVWAALAGSIFERVLAVASERPQVRRMRSVIGDYRTVQAIGKIDSRDSGMPAFEPFTWALAKRSSKQTPADFIASQVTLQAISHVAATFLQDYDMFLSPVLGSPAYRIGQIDQSKPYDELVEELTDYVAFTPLANFSGMPAMSVPLWWTPNSLPIGSHFLGRFGDESTLIQLAGQLERARPWFNRVPTLPA